MAIAPEVVKGIETKIEEFVLGLREKEKELKALRKKYDDDKRVILDKIKELKEQQFTFECALKTYKGEPLPQKKKS